jgi:hypothetical protein
LFEVVKKILKKILMSAEEIKQEFIDHIKSLDPKIEMSTISYSILDEAIESILNGNIKINNEIPSNEEQRFFSIGQYIIVAQSALTALIKDTKKSEPNAKINLQYRGQSHEF